MTFRSLGLVPALALLAVGAAHAQGANQATTGGGGSMAYPDSLPSGQVRIPAPTGRDTGSMAYPASPGGVTEGAPTGRDTGNMALPTGRSALNSGSTAMPMAARMASPPMRPDVAPMAPDTAAARSLSMAPASAPIPYTDFDTPTKPMGRKGAMMHKAPIHHAVAHKAAPKATPAAAAPAAATPAAPAAPAK